MRSILDTKELDITRSLEGFHLICVYIQLVKILDEKSVLATGVLIGLRRGDLRKQGWE